MLSEASGFKPGFEDAARQCTIDLDVGRAKKLWAEVAPHLPAVPHDDDMLFQLHMARTGMTSAPLALRQFSHRWLGERGFGSQLPEQFWPKGGDRRA